MPTDLTEQGSEQAIEADLLSRGYTEGDPKSYPGSIDYWLFDPVPR